MDAEELCHRDIWSATEHTPSGDSRKLLLFTRFAKSGDNRHTTENGLRMLAMQDGQFYMTPGEMKRTV